MMKVLIPYASNFTDISRGGIQNFISRTLKNFPENINVTIVGLGARPKNLNKKISWISLLNDEKCLPKNLHYRFARALKESSLELQSFDIIIHHRPETLVFTRGGINLLVLHSPTWGVFKTRKLRNALGILLFELLAVKKASKVLTVNLKGTSSLSKKLAKELHEIPVPVSQGYFSTQYPPLSKKLIYVGRVEKGKGVEQLLTLSKKIDYPISVIGDGSLLATLETKSNEIGVSAQFLGFCDESKIIEEYRKGGIVVSASSSEGNPISLIEALASRLPVVVLKTGDWVEKAKIFGANLQRLDEFSPETIDLITEDQWEKLHDSYHETAVSKIFWSNVLDHQLDKVN